MTRRASSRLLPAAPAAPVADRTARQPIRGASGAATTPADPTAPSPAATPRTQHERRAEAEARLLATARRLVARRGWEGTTLGDVGEAAGYSRGLAGHYFGSKAGLLRAITEQINDSMMDEVRKAGPVEPGLKAILHFVSVYLGRKDPEWTNTRSLLNLLTHALLEGSEHADLMVNFNMSMFRYLEDNIRSGIEQGEIDAAVSAPLGAEFVIGMLRGTMLQRLLKGGDVQAKTLCKHIQALIERAFRAR